MQACENAIVTVKLKNEQIDMELPVFLEIEKLLVKMLEAFKVMCPEKYSFANSIHLTFKGEILNEDCNLASYGIWDGSIINCVLE